MKAALFHEVDEPLIIEDVETPQVGPREVLVKVAACGICRSDLLIIRGFIPTSKKPIILGHEASGIVMEIGEEVLGFKRGDRVVINWLGSTCGTCYHCTRGRSNLCLDSEIIGVDMDGAFAEYIKIPETALIKLAEGLPLEESAIIADAVSTPLHALLTVGRISSEDVVAIFGVGGLGINAVQIAVNLASEAIAVDVVNWKLKAALELGATAAINAGREDPIYELRRITDGVGVDIAFDFSGSVKAVSDAFWSVKEGGEVVIAGLCFETLDLNMLPLVRKEIGLRGSYGYTAQDVHASMEFIQHRKIDLEPVITHRVSLEEINEGLELVRRGESFRTLVISSK
jgi:2-desacetyl-2-hydroxyethyl bacteriochlorophyllide A dehydrogenase